MVRKENTRRDQKAQEEGRIQPKRERPVIKTISIIKSKGGGGGEREMQAEGPGGLWVYLREGLLKREMCGCGRV